LTSQQNASIRDAVNPATETMSQRESKQTIQDFGAQWTRFTDNSGYYGSSELFDDIVAPLMDASDVRGAKVADIGSGTGRIVDMLLRAGAARVAAIEPSEAIEVLRDRFADSEGRVTCHHVTGEHVDELGPFDLVVSIGVLHHIPEPAPVASAAHRALRPGGRFFAWLYAREGNGVYLALVLPLRAITKRLPDRILDGVVRLLDLPLVGYIALCRFLPLPMQDYMRNVVGRMAPDKRRLIIFDQLNPEYAQYYTRAEAEALFAAAGFSNIRLYQRHGYSWSVVGTKP
jgi:2-polyprenyl-3-methyl-5-hydroxy-6-metoxy-1,4-benzoquinol methylase